MTILEYYSSPIITMNDVNKSGCRGRPRSFNTDVALERAMAIFWARGYEGSSVPALSEAMGISAQSLYAAFESKEHLYRTAMARYQATLGGFSARALAEEADAIAALIRLLGDAADLFSQFPETPGCMVTTAPSGASDDVLARFGRQLRADASAAVEARLRQGLADGQIRADADCATWAGYITGVVQGMSVQARDGVSRDPLRRIAALAARSLDSLRPT
jgi:AcrR family transcriptional regulator